MTGPSATSCEQFLAAFFRKLGRRDTHVLRRLARYFSDDEVFARVQWGGELKEESLELARDLIKHRLVAELPDAVNHVEPVMIHNAHELSNRLIALEGYCLQFRRLRTRLWLSCSLAVLFALGAFWFIAFRSAAPASAGYFTHLEGRAKFDPH